MIFYYFLTVPSYAFCLLTCLIISSYQISKQKQAYDVCFDCEASKKHSIYANQFCRFHVVATPVGESDIVCLMN